MTVTKKCMVNKGHLARFAVCASSQMGSIRSVLFSPGIKEEHSVDITFQKESMPCF